MKDKKRVFRIAILVIFLGFLLLSETIPNNISKAEIIQSVQSSTIPSNSIINKLTQNTNFLRLNINGTINTLENDFANWINTIVTDLINVFSSFVQNISKIVVGAISTVLGGVFGFVGVPFTSWSQYVAKNGSWFIPIIFVGILGLAFLIAEAINVAYGFERDIGEGEADIGTEEGKIAEEEEEE